MRGARANGHAIRAARLARGLTQEQLAAQADMDVKTIRKAERGGRLDVGTLARLALALDADLRHFIQIESSDSADNLRTRRNAVERWQAAWDHRDLDALLALYHEQIVLHLPGGPNLPFSGDYTGKEEVRHAHETAWATAQTIPQRPEDYSLIVADNWVVLHGMRGVRLPDGNEVWLSNIHIFTFSGELIIDHRVDYDTLGFSRALKLPGPAGD